MIVCFDLDDTLYPEIEYVKSGFKAVSRYLAINKTKTAADTLYCRLVTLLNDKGRGQVFDILLKEEGIYSKYLVKKCIGIYRAHVPEIMLSDSVINILEKISEKYGNTYLVTDGNLIAQRNKIKKLKLERYFFKCMPTHQYGRQHSKPSLYCFERIKGWEGVDYPSLIYIGDNPYKDFVALNSVGATTIRVNSGMFKDIFLDKAHEATYLVDSLEEVLKIL